MLKTTRNVVLLTCCFLLVLCGWRGMVYPESAHSQGEKAGGAGTAASCDVKYVPFPPELKKYQVYPWEMLQYPEFKKAYVAMLGTKKKEAWVRTLKGPSPPNKAIVLLKKKMIMITTCKQHYCDSHHVVVFFESEARQSWALLKEQGSTTWLGDPDSQIKRCLQAALFSEYKEAYKTESQ